MEREVGSKDFPVWLLGDSNPPQWEAFLDTPLDPRHPIRHNIWTSVLNVIQDRVFRECRSRMDTSSLYIRNAVENPSVKPSQSSVAWNQDTDTEVEILKNLINEHTPILLICFGAFSFEFARRAVGESIKQAHGYWRAQRLGEEFRRRVAEFAPDKTNVLPLLHRSISGGKFIESHNYFCGFAGTNYFEVVGNSIANKLIQHRQKLPIWIE